MAKKRRHVPYERDGLKLGKRTTDKGIRWVIDLRGQGNHGGPKRIGLTSRSEEGARAELDAFCASQAAIKRQQQAYTVGQLWEMWLREREADKLSNEIYRANWAALGPCFASKPAETLTAQIFRDYAQARFTLGRSSWTVQTELVRLRACLKWAAENHHIARRPKVWVPAPGKHRDRVLSLEEAKRLVQAAQAGDPHISLFVIIAFATGARHKAILDLDWDRVDFVSGVIQFDDQPQRDPMSKAWRKGRALVPMNRAVRAALEVAYEGRQSQYVIEHGGRRLKSVKSGFANAVARAGLVGITPHTIRHSVASWLEDRVGDARRAQLLGHGNIETTRKVYTHSGAAMLEEAVSYLDFAPLPRLNNHADEGTSASAGDSHPNG